MNRRYLTFIHQTLITCEILALPLIAIASWISSIYIPAAHSLLDAEGLRWMATNIVSNFIRLPIPQFILLLIALSTLYSSGIHSLFSRHATTKQHRAALFALITLLINITAVCLLTFIPPYILLSPFGTFAGSPLSRSIPGLLFIVIETTALTYGYTSGKITTPRDFTSAHSILIQKSAPIFIHLFLLSQIASWLRYSAII